MTLTDEDRAACAEYTKAAGQDWSSRKTDAAPWKALVKAIGNEDEAFFKWLTWCDEQFSAQGGGR
jgi:hypothetical protein